MIDQAHEYRRQLVDLEQRSQGEYDRTVLSLSGGALAVSFAFVKQFADDGSVSAPGLLVAGWAMWVVSLAAVLASHYFSTLAIRSALTKVDKGEIAAPIGGRFESAVVALNAGGGVAFVAGLVFGGIFLYNNIG